MFLLNLLNSVTRKLKNKNKDCGIGIKISCVKDRDDTTGPQRKVTGQILMLNPIHASVIPQISR